MVCVPKECGGLGVLNLHTHDQSLILKNLHKFFNRLDIPWVNLVWEARCANGRLPTRTRKGSFWWHDIQKLLPVFKGMAMATVINGSSCFFWLDSWNGFSFGTNMLESFSFAKDRFITVQHFYHSLALHDLFHLPLSEETYHQFIHLLVNVQNLNLQEGFDAWSYIWNSSIFTSKCAYVHLIGNRQVRPAFSWLWKSCCQNKRKFFFWLLLKDRLSTRELLRRKGMALDDYNCVLCTQALEESLVHLILDCLFSRSCWATLGLVIQSSSDPFGTLASFKSQLQLPFFMEIIVTMC